MGFKWFVEGLFEGSCCFGGEESAGASFLKKTELSGQPSKDSLIMNLLAANYSPHSKDPGEIYKELMSNWDIPGIRGLMPDST